MDEKESKRLSAEDDLSEAIDLDRRFTEAMGRKDLDAAMECFWNDPDLVVVLWGKIQRGPEAVRAGIKEILDKNESLKVEINEVKYLPSGDVVIGVGTATYEMKTAGGPCKLMVERWSDVRRKIDGRWVYVLDHASEIP
jgi:ketosteroid isomerase-like protein